MQSTSKLNFKLNFISTSKEKRMLCFIKLSQSLFQAKFFIDLKTKAIMSTSKRKNETKINEIINDIKTVKIQGAENIARAGIKTFLLSPTKANAKKILSSRPTEPLMQNTVNFLLRSKDKKNDAKKFLQKLREAHEKIVLSGSTLIKNDMKIFSHCHSSTVIDILKYAKRKLKKNFTVYTSEVQPLLQGHMTAKELSKAKIPVVIMPDLAAEQALKMCDILLFGADAFTKKFVVNKIGTSTLCKIAKSYKIPRYSCAVSYKFTKKVKIENRPSTEIIHVENNKIKVINPAFDKTSMKDLTGIISEHGILRPKSFVKLAKISSRLIDI